MSLISKINVNGISTTLATNNDITLNDDTTSANLNIGDSAGNILVEFKDGHIKTKNFDSRSSNQQSSSTPTESSILKGKTVAFLGDSITQGTGASPSSKRYSSVFCSLAECTELNLGVAGDTIGWHETYLGGFITRASQLATANFIFVFGGTNDFTYNPMNIGDYFIYEDMEALSYTGNKKKIAPTDDKHFAAALHNLIKKIRTVAPKAQLVFITPLNRSRYSTGRPTSAECNKNGDYLQDYIECIKTICQFYAIPVIELGQMFGFDWTEDKTTGPTNYYDSDGIHPNNYGHERIAKLLYKWVQNNIVL